MRAVAVISEQPKKTPKLCAWEKSGIIAACAERDGWRCFYCTTKLTRGTATIEHFVARALGGPNHLANYALACESCNRAVADKSVMLKVRHMFEWARRLKAEKARTTMAFIRERNERDSIR